MHAVSVCFRSPPNYDMDYRIFNMPTQSFSACIYMRVCLYLFFYTEWLPFFHGGGGGLGPPFFFFHLIGLKAPFYEVLEATLDLVMCDSNAWWYFCVLYAFSLFLSLLFLFVCLFLLLVFFLTGFIAVAVPFFSFFFLPYVLFISITGLIKNNKILVAVRFCCCCVVVVGG